MLTPDQLNQLVSGLGFPIVFIVGVLAFFGLKVWPWISARVDRQDNENMRRHDGYLEEIRQNREVFARVIRALDALVHEITQTTERIETNRGNEAREHEQMIAELRALRDVREPLPRDP